MMGRTALVTGADTRGMGRAIGFGLARHGASVVFGAFANPERAQRAAVATRRVGGNAEAMVFDITDVAQINDGLDRIEQDIGIVDCLVSCAGVIERNRLVDTSDDAIAQVLEVNVAGTARVNREVARRLIRAGKTGSIVNVSSVTREVAAARMPVYAASKGAIWSMTRAIALDLSEHGIRVNSVSPGSFLTDFNRHILAGSIEQRSGAIPLARVGRPRDVVGAVLFLASDASSYVTGEDIRVDGGMTLA